MIKKNEKMNPESIKSLKEFNKRQVQSNIKLHKIFLSMIIIINIFLIGFIFMYKSKISDIKSKLEIHSSKLRENEKYISSLDNMYSHKLVNIFATSMNIYGNYHFSLIFDTSEEVKNIKNLISSFAKIENPSLDLIYQGIYDGNDAERIMFLISFLSHILIIVETRNGVKFGLFFNDKIEFEEGDEYKYFNSESNNCFLFSLNFNEKYNCNSKGKTTFEINGLGLFNIGNEDIIISHDFNTDGGRINFPLESFDIKESDLGYGMFKNLANQFDIFDIEIYSVWEF
jgi:cell division protein FtsL